MLTVDRWTGSGESYLVIRLSRYPADYLLRFPLLVMHRQFARAIWLRSKEPSQGTVAVYVELDGRGPTCHPPS